MTRHPDSLPNELIGDEAAGEQPVAMGESSTTALRSLAGRLLYWWSWFVAAMLLLIFGPPALLAAYLARRRHWVYPWARFGARNWLRLSGMKVRVRGREHLDPRQTYVFISNHRSYLDTA
ncbi:MAG: hypothetical protein LC672_01115, partial [Acidobacteria bacterium]|nr:hypothetical protein [Acidobacteriota bacterium]